MLTDTRCQLFCRGSFQQQLRQTCPRGPTRYPRDSGLHSCPWASQSTSPTRRTETTPCSTELVSSIGAVIKTPVGVEYTYTSENRLLDHAMVDRRLASVVQVEPFWTVPWESHIALEVTVCRAPRTHTMRIACILENFPQGKSVGKDDWDKTKIGPRDKGRCSRPSGKRGNDTAATFGCMGTMS